MKKVTIHAVVVFALIAITTYSSESMSAPPADLQGAFRPVEFVESVGAMEFSGSMIARPWPTQHWTESGLDTTEAVQKYENATRFLTDNFRIMRYQQQTDHYVFIVPENLNENAVANELLATGMFKFVEPNWRVFPTDCPNDPRFAQQWHHDAAHFDSCAGWSVHTGEPNVAIGVCDTGVRFTHEDLQLHRLEGYNAVDRQWESEGGQINDIYGHGTEATGTAAANGNNGIGVSGIGWNLSHRMLRVTNSQGGSSSLAILNHAAVTAIESGDKVASLSYSGVQNQSVLDTATYIRSIGGLMIWAAGNAGRNLNMNHRDDDDVIVVGAVNRSDNHESWSNYGIFVDLVAYGSQVLTVSSTGDTSYRDFGGTSAACPQTSGLAATLWSANPSLSPDDIEQILKNTCVDLGTSGQDNTYGYGRIHVGDALAQILPQTELTGFEVVSGDLLTGNLEDLIASDDSYIHTRSGFGETLVDLHNMEVIVAAATVVDSPSALDIKIESRIDEPSGLAQIRLHNWNTDEFDVVGSYSIGNSDQVDVINNIDATNYVIEAGATEIELSIKHLVFVPFLAFTFDSFIDQVEIVVE